MRVPKTVMAAAGVRRVWVAWLRLCVSCGVALLLTVPAKPADALETLTVGSADTRVGLGAGHLHLLRDSQGDMRVDEAIAALEAGRFTPLAGNLGIGYTRDAAWIAISLERSPDAPADWVLQLEPPTLDLVELYQQHGQQLSRQVSGDGLPVSQRATFHRSAAFELNLAEGSTRLLLRIKTTSQVTAIPFLWQSNAFSRAVSTEALLGGIFLGVLSTVLLYSLIIFFSVREKLFLIYCLLVLSSALFWLSFDGFVGLFLLPQQPLLANQLLGALLAVVIFAGNYFYAKALKVGPSHRLSQGVLRLIYLMCLASVVSLFFGAFHLFLPWLLGVAMLGLPVLGFHSLRQIYGGGLEQKTFGLSYVIYGGLAVTTIGMNLSLLPATLWTAYASQFGQFVHVLALQLGLFFRLRARERERNEARLQLELADQENRYLHLAANTDPLTGLHNRRSFLDQYQQEMARIGRNQAQLPSLAIMDLDRFKSINDDYGHEMGDLVLTQFAQLLKRLLRSTDVCGRWGGEEFAVLLPRTSLDEALAVLERIRQGASRDSIASPTGEALPMVTVSIGVTRVAHGQESVNEAIRRADKGLYRAKKAGRNRTCAHLTPDHAMMTAQDQTAHCRP